MTLRIAIVTESSGWMTPYVSELAARWRGQGHTVIQTDVARYDPVDAAFFLSYGRLVDAEGLALARANLVVHGSALPEGRGWSPWSWEILRGNNRLALTLFEAAEGVDSGPIYDQRWVELQGHELIDEWQGMQARVTVAMCADFIDAFPGILERARPQQGEPSYHPRRRSQDSRLDPDASIAAQFGLLRIVDNQRYPAYFEHEGHRYKIAITRWDAVGGKAES